MKFRLLLLLPVLLAAAPLGAALVSLNAPVAPVAAGAAVRVELVVVNPGAAPATYALPADLDGRLAGTAGEWRVNVRAQTADVAVPPGGFARVPLDFVLPRGAAGRLVLELAQPVAVRAVLDVGTETAAPVRAQASDLASSEPVTAAASPSLPAASRLKRYYADHFSAHEPIYFVFGDEKPAAKFQFSLKYRLLNDSGPLASYAPALRGLHVAYSQRSLWDITSDSSPFFDSSYMPEFLFESLAPDRGTTGGFTWIGWQAAVQHESNGRAGADSRSMNLFYVRPMAAFGDLDGWRLILRPKFFVYLDREENRDIADYRGYSELRAIFGKNNRLSVSVTGRIGAEFEKGSLQVDVSYPTEFLSGNLAMYLHLHYFTGYGESLLRYDRHSDALRAGFSIAR